MNIFSHGENIQNFAKTIECNLNEVIDFSLNINFVKPQINIDFNHVEITSYPNYDQIYENIAKLYSVKKGEIELFNGGSSAIFSLFKHLALEKCVIYSPAYLEYKKAATLFGYETMIINRFIDIDEPVEKNSLVIFVNPSSPDGRYYPLETLFERWRDANATVLIDESFLDFTNEKSAIEFIKCYPKLYILKSMSKFYGTAGVRISAIISNKIAISQLKHTEPMWKISQFDIHYVSEALKDKSFKKIAKALGAKNNIVLEQILITSNLFEKVYPSSSNFILGKLAKLKANELQNYLSNYKILIRDCSNFDGLDESYVRFSVKSTKELEELEKALKNFTHT
jgi:threonine-phosphate decarboxylase